MGRVISYGEKTGYNDGDYLLLDNGEGGTKRIRADRVGVWVYGYLNMKKTTLNHLNTPV